MGLTDVINELYMHGVDSIVSAPWAVALEKASTPWAVALNVLNVARCEYIEPTNHRADGRYRPLPAIQEARTFAAAPGKNKQEFMSRNLFLTPPPPLKKKGHPRQTKLYKRKNRTDLPMTWMSVKTWPFICRCMSDPNMEITTLSASGLTVDCIKSNVP